MYKAIRCRFVRRSETTRKRPPVGRERTPAAACTDDSKGGAGCCPSGCSESCRGQGAVAVWFPPSRSVELERRGGGEGDVACPLARCGRCVCCCRVWKAQQACRSGPRSWPGEISTTVRGKTHVICIKHERQAFVGGTVVLLKSAGLQLRHVAEPLRSCTERVRASLLGCRLTRDTYISIGESSNLQREGEGRDQMWLEFLDPSIMMQSGVSTCTMVERWRSSRLVHTQQQALALHRMGRILYLTNKALIVRAAAPVLERLQPTG